MSVTIYEKTPSGLYATGDRTVSTFPSGLIRVDQTFVCRTSAAATHRADLAVGADMPGGSTPAIDGLKIFPEPQERKRDDGFTEFIVSAYGRVRTSFYNPSAQTVRQRISNKGFVIVNGGALSSVTATTDCTYIRLKGGIVLPKGSGLSVDQLNIPIIDMGIKDIIHVKLNPNTRLSELTPLQTKTYQYLDWSGVTRSNQFTIYKYSEVFYLDELNSGNSVEYYIKYDTPIISVNSRTEYGNFTEMDISVSGKAYAIIERVDPNAN